MPNVTIYLFLFSLVVANVLSERTRDYEEEPEQGGKSFFLLGGLFRRIKSRWQNQNLPPSPYGSGYSGYYGCGFYNCRPPQFQVIQPVEALQPVQAVQPVPAIIQTPIVIQQAQVYQPNSFAQAVAQPNPGPMYPVQPQSQLQQQSQLQPPPQLQPQQFQYPVPPPYGIPQPAYGSPQPYQPYPMYPSAYASSVPGQIYQSAGCAFPAYPCGRNS